MPRRVFSSDDTLAQAVSDMIVCMRTVVSRALAGHRQNAASTNTLTVASWPPQFKDLRRQLIVACIRHLAKEGQTILVFVDGVHALMELEEDILELAGAEEKLCVMKLHALVPKEEEEKVMDGVPGKCKVILSTVVGVSSITFPDSSVVIDTGEVK